MRDAKTSVQCNVNNKWIICRVCLKTSTDLMMQIFDGDEAAENLVGKIEEYGGVTVHYAADLPDKICPKCLLLLKAAHKFRTLCQNSQRHLMALLQLTEDEDACSDSETTDFRAVDTEGKSKNIDVENKFVKPEKEDDNVCVTYEAYNIDEENSVDILESSDFEYIELHSHTIDYLDDESNQNCISDEVSCLSNEHYEIIHQNESQLNFGDNAHDRPDENEMNNDVSKEQEPKEKVQTDTTGDIKQEPSATKPVRKTARERKLKKNVVTAINEAANSEEPYEDPTYVCCHCGNVYNEKAKLTLHKKFHTKEKPHECEICHKRFAQTPQLARHMNSHTGTRPFKCKFCDSSFADPSTCIKHQRIHTNERPYQCETCGKSFSYSNVLKVHIMTHTGEKPHKCQYCGKKFTQSHHKRTHERTHNHFPNDYESLPSKLEF